MENFNLDSKLLDTAISTMARNRALLFTINLLAALLLTVAYLEKFSIDRVQKEGHLISYRDHCTELNNTLKKLSGWKALSLKEMASFSSCSNLDAMRDFALTNASLEKKSAFVYSDSLIQFIFLNTAMERIPPPTTEEITQKISEKLFKLQRIRNEMSNTRLEVASAAPIGFGLQIPRNDLVIIGGFLLLMFYMWLMFSFRQHARIINKIKLLFPDQKVSDPHHFGATVNDLIELNFLFRTSGKEFARHLVRFMYGLAPVTMIIMIFNEYYSPITTGFNEFLSNYFFYSFLIQVAITTVLLFIAYQIYKSDRESNKEIKDLIELHGFRLGMTDNKVGKLFNVPKDLKSLKLDMPLIEKTLKQKEKLNFGDVERLLIFFVKEERKGFFDRWLFKLNILKENFQRRIYFIKIVYSKNICWDGVEEFARYLSEYFDLPFQFWSLDFKKNQGRIHHKDFILKINSVTNEVILFDIAARRKKNAGKNPKANFKP